VIYWEFDSEGRATLLPSADIPSLRLTNGKDEHPKPIKQYDCSEAHKYLGLWNPPSLSMKPNLAALLTTTQSYAKRLFKSGLNAHEVWLAYFAFCRIPTARFTSPQTLFYIGNHSESMTLPSWNASRLWTGSLAPI
jgi:hypothetical protein